MGYLMKEALLKELASPHVLGVVGGIWVALYFLSSEQIWGVPVPPLSYEDNALSIIGSLLLMSFIECKIREAGRQWREVSYALALAVTFGLALVYGVKTDIAEGIVRFALLLPVAIVTLRATKYLFPDVSRHENERTEN